MSIVNAAKFFMKQYPKTIKVFRGERANAPGKMMVGNEMVPYSDKLKGRFFTANEGIARRFADYPFTIKSTRIPEKDFNIGTKLARRINVDQMADQLILPKKYLNQVETDYIQTVAARLKATLDYLTKGIN